MKLLGKRFSRPGTAPGTLTAPEVRRIEQVTFSVMSYGPESLDEHTPASAGEALSLLDPSRVTWIDVVGLHDVEVLQGLGEGLSLHSLALEDVLNTGQRPKLEDYGEVQFVVLRLPHLNETLESEQISLFLGRGWVLTFQEVPEDVFDGVRERLRGGRGKIRRLGADYLLYALVDALVDSLFPVLEAYGDRIEELEDRLLEEPTPELLEAVQQVKKDLLHLRRSAWPQREVIHALQRSESGLVGEETRVFLRDCYDHGIQILDILETYRDLASGLTDLYLSSVSHRMNEVMKVLTVIATIFIPMTFIAGVYGMNFLPEASPWNMPELSWRFGYPLAWGAMLAVAAAMLLYFRRKGWW